MHIVDRYQPEKSLQLHPQLTLKTIAVIARDSKNETKTGSHKFNGKKGFAPYIRQAVHAASGNGADVILFSLWSHNASAHGELLRTDFFPKGTRHSAVIVGVVRRDDKSKKDQELLEVWHRSSRVPFVFSQLFGKTSASKAAKKSLVDGLSQRQFGPTLFLLCGETNIVRTQRSKSGILDEFGILPRVRASRVKCILNPIHSYMRRYEMVLKREALAKAAGCMISVWNRGLANGSESTTPWALYRNGKTEKNAIREIDLPIPSQPGVRIGIIDSSLIK
jgi:hypothetical protein